MPNVQTHSPVFRALAVPEWLNSPRSTSAATWQTSERARTGSRTVTAEASFDSPRRRSTRSLGNIHSGTVSSDPSSETLTDVRQDRQSVPRYSQDSQGQLEAAHAPSGNNGHQVYFTDLALAHTNVAVHCIMSCQICCVCDVYPHGPQHLSEICWNLKQSQQP